MNKTVKGVLALTVICLLSAVSLSLVYRVTLPLIAADKEDFASVLPGGSDFVPLDNLSGELPQSVSGMYTAKGGCVVELTLVGYKPNLVLWVGVSEKGELAGFKVVETNETLGAEQPYLESAVGLDISKVKELDTVSGATRTTRAVKAGLMDALEAAERMGFGSSETE